MARLSDFQQQAPTRNFEAERLCDVNALKVSKNVVSYLDTHIASTMGACESNPIGFMRDAAIADSSRRKRLHTTLDRMCCDAGFTAEEGHKFHRHLDRVMDDERDENHLELSDDDSEEEPEESESEEPDDDSEEQLESKMMDVLQEITDSANGHRKVNGKSSRPKARKPSIAFDSASVLNRYLQPEHSIEYARWALECNLLNEQRDSSTSNERRTLLSYLAQMPKGSCVRDCSTKVLVPLIRKLESNSNLIPA